MKNNQKGFAEVAILYAVIAVIGLLYIPNPVSSAIGVGIRPNKTVQKEMVYEKVELLRDPVTNEPVKAEDGSFMATRSGSTRFEDTEKQQKVSLWEQLRSLPVLYLFLMGLGIVSPGIAGLMAKFNSGAKKTIKAVLGEKEALMSDTKKIVKGLDEAFKTVQTTLVAAKLPGEVDIVKLADEIVEEMKWTLGDVYNDSTKSLVKGIRNI